MNAPDSHQRYKGLGLAQGYGVIVTGDCGLSGITYWISGRSFTKKNRRGRKFGGRGATLVSEIRSYPPSAYVSSSIFYLLSSGEIFQVL